MILGIGNDLVDIRRIERALQRYGQRFLDRVFTEGEQVFAQRRHASFPVYAGTLAKRFAAKEALAKALGTGFGRKGIQFRDLGVEVDDLGAPAMVLYGGAERHLEQLLPNGMAARIHLTMTDEYPYASAVVLLEAVALDPGQNGNILT